MAYLHTAVIIFLTSATVYVWNWGPMTFTYEPPADGEPFIEFRPYEEQPALYLE